MVKKIIILIRVKLKINKTLVLHFFLSLKESENWGDRVPFRVDPRVSLRLLPRKKAVEWEQQNRWVQLWKRWKRKCWQRLGGFRKAKIDIDILRSFDGGSARGRWRTRWGVRRWWTPARSPSRLQAFGGILAPQIWEILRHWIRAYRRRPP